MRWTLALVITLGLAGCGDSREPTGDAGLAECAQAASFREGEPCTGSVTCELDDGCCATTWTCEEGVRVSATRCGLPGCFTTCADALESALHGDPCEGAFLCSRFDDRLCCTHSVECVRGRVQVEDSCPPGCAP